MGLFSTYRSIRMFVGIAFLVLIIALVKYFEVKRLVEGSPYWATDPKTAREFKTHVADATFQRNEAPREGPNPKLLGVWLEHSYSYVRTGLFTCKVVVNPERKARALFEKEKLFLLRNGGWRIEVDGQIREAALATNGAIVDGFLVEVEASHNIRVLTAEGTASEWTIWFENAQGN